MNVELDGATRLLFQATADGQAEPTPGNAPGGTMARGFIPAQHL